MHLRPLALGLAAGLVTVMGAACSSGESSDSNASAPAASGDGRFPATVQTKFGEVKIEEKPQRVVALGWGDAETALSLGVEPVGASDWLAFGGEGIGPWMTKKYTNPPTMIGTMEPSYEQIAALRPDLILDVKGSGDQQRHQRLSSIAPTVGIPKDGDNFLTPTNEQTTMIATALGEQEQGKKLNQEVQDKFAAAAAAHPNWKGKSFAAATKTSEGWGAYVKGSDRVTFLENLGFTLTPKIAAAQPDATGFSTQLAAENLSDLDSDVVVAFPIFVDTAQVTNDPAFRSVPAVRQGHAVVIDGDLAKAYSLGTTTATSYAIDQLVPKLETSIGK